MRNSHIKLFLFAILLSGCTPVGKVVRPPVKSINIDDSDWPACSQMATSTDFDKFFEEEYFGERLQLAGRVSGAIEELEDSVSGFTEQGSLVEIFPTFLKYQMEESLKTGMSDSVRHNTEYLKIVLLAYDAYRVNRDSYDKREPDSVDRQWAEYFRKAEKFDDEWTPEQGVDVLLDGINAHVLSDLPRAIRFVKLRTELEPKEMETDFKKTDKDFLVAETRLKKDVLGLFENAEARDSVQRLFGNGYEYVKYSRGKAFEMGSGKGPLGVIEEQAQLNHDWKSRKYFPESVRKRGICRYTD